MYFSARGGMKSEVLRTSKKNATKGLGALWTPVWALWVCLTEDIHGGGFEKRSANVCGDAFLTPRQTQPKVGAACPSCKTMAFSAREGERVTPCRWEGSCRSRAYGQEAEVSPAEKQSTFPPSWATNRAVGTLTAVRVIGPWRLFARSTAFAVAKVVRAVG
jgi:hypothetical protein